VNDESERIWKEAVVAYSGICLEVVMKTKNFSQDSRSPAEICTLDLPNTKQDLIRRKRTEKKNKSKRCKEGARCSPRVAPAQYLPCNRKIRLEHHKVVSVLNRSA
jgi:hypothetical protein